MSVTVTRKPFKEAPFSEGLRYPTFAALAEKLTHYELSNGYTVSVLHSVWGWEAWAWPTETESATAAALTPEPIVFATEDEAVAYRDQVDAMEAA